MKITSKHLPKCIVEITLEDTAVAYEKARAKALASLSTRVSVKGFRAWAKVPEALVLKEVGDARLADEALDIYLKQVYPQILSESKITPIAPGNVTEIKSLDPLVIILQIEILPVPALDMKKIQAIKLKKTEVSADAKETDEAIAEIEKRFTHFHAAGHVHGDGFDATESSVAMGDRVTIGTQGFDKKWGEPIVETRVMDFPLVIGSGQFIPGFEWELIGKVANEEIGFNITFPADYHSEAFKGRKVYFVTTITLIEKAHRPEWTPEFIEQLRGVKTDMAGFREILSEEILGEKERKAREIDEKVLLEKLTEYATLEVGDALVAKEAENIWNEQKTNLESQGYNMKTYLEHLGTTEEGYKSGAIAVEAARRVRAEIILKALRDEMKVEATDTEITLEINKIISQYQNPEVVARLKAKLVPGDTYYEDIRNRLAYRKVVDSFFTK